jgi:ADP-ribose pyrophosphatase YjhB (NUDIX family)
MRLDYAEVVSSAPPMATPRVAAGVLFRDHHGRVLLVKPTYKDGWDLPGGYVEPGESPKQTARREVLEELGIEPPVGRLLAFDWAPHPNEGDKLLFIFDGGYLAGRPAPASTAADEIEAVRFWDVHDLHQALPARLRIRVTSACEINGDDAYLEHGSSTDLRPVASKPT